MKFNKILLMGGFVITGVVNGTEVVSVVKSHEEQQFAQIQDALTVLPPINHYLAKTQNVTKRYENVFMPLSETETKERIKNAKEKTINFYAEIFGVKLAEIEQYKEDFTTAMYLAWVAKEIIEDGEYLFAKDAETLFDAGLNKQPDIDFSQHSSNAYPNPKLIPGLYQIYAPYNDPYFEALIIHETGHVLEYAYRVLRSIKNETRDSKNWGACEDAVSVFFETLYTRKNDITFSLLRLSDYYRIKFRQAFNESIKNLGANDQKNNPELRTKIGNLSSKISRYEPWKRDNDHKKMELSEDERTKNDSEENYRKYIITKYPAVKHIYDLWENQATEWGTTKLPFSDRISDIGIVSWRLRGFLEVYSRKRNDAIDRYDAIKTYIQYPTHVYRTLKIADKLKPGKEVINALDNIVNNVPKMMTKQELEDFMTLLKLK